MAKKYRHKGRVDFFEEVPPQGPNLLTVIAIVFVALMILGAITG